MIRNLLPILALAIAVPAGAQTEEDDVAGRGVARISVINGDVSVRRGDSGDWTAAAINAPLMAQDRLLTGSGSRAEIQFDFANMIRVAADSEVRLADLENRRYLLQIARGLVTFRVLRDSESEIELSTPSISIRPSRRGVYRVSVKEDGTTEVTVRSGEAEIFTPKGSERVRSGKTVMARGSQSDPEFMYANRELPEDEWDRWNVRRDNDLERSRSYNYVSRDIYGAEDLDSHGRWMNDPDYGYVWTPTVSAGWAPYRAGRWVWVDWYGWTWVSYDPWGWAPYHYGRWYHHSSWGWCWWPGGGPRYRTFWRPALVGFIGWNNYSGFSAGIGFGRVGWFPLGPREAYRPWYGSRYYGRGGNINVINNVNITNVYRNTRIHNGITAVDGADFSSGRVNRIHSVSRDDLSRASMVNGRLPVTPGRESLRMADREVRGREGSGNERFYSRREPARLERVSFDDQRRGIEAASGRRGDDGTRGGGRGAESFSANDSRRANDGGRRVGDTSDRGWRSVGGGQNGAGSINARPAEENGGRRSADQPDRGGWRRMGETRSGTEGGSRQSIESAGPAEANGGGRRNADQSDRGGWRRMGETGSGTEGGSRQSIESAGPAEANGGGRRNADQSDRGGWRRFGGNGSSDNGGRRESDPGSVTRSEDRGSRRNADPGERGGWRQFGEPGSGTATTRGSEDRGSRRNSDNAPRNGWNSFGDPAGSGSVGGSRNRSESAPATASPRRTSDTPGGWRNSSESPRETRRQDRSSSEGPVRVSPPVVRERSSGSETRRFEPSGGGRSGWGGGRSSERSVRSGGSWSGGGGRSSGGGWSGGGGGGGGRSSGGGWSGGGGGGGGRSGGGGGGGGRSGGGGRHR